MPVVKMCSFCSLEKKIWAVQHPISYPVIQSLLPGCAKSRCHQFVLFMSCHHKLFKTIVWPKNGINHYPYSIGMMSLSSSDRCNHSPIHHQYRDRKVFTLLHSNSKNHANPKIRRIVCIYLSLASNQICALSSSIWISKGWQGSGVLLATFLL